jgi:hypothetical protein
MIETKEDLNEKLILKMEDGFILILQMIKIFKHI